MTLRRHGASPDSLYGGLAGGFIKCGVVWCLTLIKSHKAALGFAGCRPETVVRNKMAIGSVLRTEPTYPLRIAGYVYD